MSKPRQAMYLNKVRCFFITFLCAFSIQSYAQDLPVLIAHYRDRPPDMINYCGDRHDGPLRIILEEAASRIGYRIEWKREPSLARSFKALEEGTADILPYIFIRTPEREALYRFGESLGMTPRPVSFVFRIGAKHALGSVADLEKFRVGYLKNVYLMDVFHDNDKIEKIAYSTPVALAKGLSDREIDAAAIVNRDSTERSFYSVGFNEFEYADYMYELDSDLYYVYSRAPAHQQAFDKLDEAIRELKREGAIRDIYKSFDATPPK